MLQLDGDAIGQAGLDGQLVMRAQLRVARRAFDRLDDPAVVERAVGSSRVDLQACKLEYSIVSPK